MGGVIVRRWKPQYVSSRRWYTAGWLVSLKYFLRGRADGRRGLPTLSVDEAQKTPTLHHLAREVEVEAATVRAHVVSQTAAQRIELGELTKAGGRLTRAEQRLMSMQERLAEIEATRPEAGRRFGEEHLPESLVSARRQREHARRIRQGRKRVEDERTALSELIGRQALLEASITEELAQAEAQTRLAGKAQRSRATSYLNGALRKHRERALLSQLAPGLMPWPSSSAERSHAQDQS